MSFSARTLEMKNEKVTQALALLDKTVLEMIISHHPLGQVLESLCLNIEGMFEGLLCSVLLLDGDGVTLRHGAAPSLPKNYAEAINGAKIGPRAGSCGTAAYRGQPVVVSNIATDPLWADYRHLALPHALHACWSMPISSQNGSVLGTFACYYREPRSPDSDHLLVIDRAANLARIAIEHWRAKSDLQAAESRYRTLVERLPAITYIAEVGARGRWLFVSPQIETMLGYTPEEWMADSGLWMSRIHEDDLLIALEAEKRVQETGELYKAEYRMRARNGQVLWFRDEGKIMPEVAGTKPIMQGVLYDITEYRRLEEQLRQSQKMEAVGQLAGGVAHDFNNLLMIIGAHTDRIRERHSTQDDSYADAAEISSAVERATSLTQRLLAFSRKQVLQPQVLDLGSVLHELGSMLRRLVTENIEIKIEVEPELCPVKVDRAQLEQAIVNLTVNARDAMPEGGSIVISARKSTFERPQTFRHGSIVAGKYVTVAVKDTGCGMDAATQAHLFEPFFTTKEPGRGTGLGLSIVYGLVKQSGGAISVESKLNRGSVFTIFFPAQALEKRQRESPRFQSSPLGGKETVLLVEDQTAIRELAGHYLSELGYDVLAAPDGEAAIKLVDTSRKRIDLVVTDVVMPKMSGCELATSLGAMYPEVKVLFISGYPDDAMSGESVEGKELLQKPFSLNALAARVRSLLNSER